MTTDHQPLAAELHGCTLRQRNCATLPPPPATGRATGTQPTSLKAAAALVLQRNRARNPHATGAAPVCNFEPATGAAAVARVVPPLEAQSIGCCPDADVPVTVADVIRLHGALLLGQVLVADVCALADPIDLTDFLAPAEGEDRLYHFAALLVDAGAVRPLPDPALPPLERLACEIGDDVVELRRWLDGSAQGRRIRQRLEREPGACDCYLLALRADPAGGLLPALARALDGDRCPTGAALHALTRGTEK